jgi:hypothetical protein
MNTKGFQGELKQICDEELHVFLAKHPNLEEIILPHFPTSKDVWHHIVNMKSVKKIDFNVHLVTDEMMQGIKMVEQEYGIKLKKRFRAEVNFWTITLEK